MARRGAGQVAQNKEQHDELVKALYEGRTNRVYDREEAKSLPKAVWGYLHKDAMWFGEELEATPEQIRGFYRWYRNAYPDQQLPQVHETIEREWANFLLGVVHALPEKRIQTGPVAPPAEVYDDWKRGRVSQDEAFANNPELAELARSLFGTPEEAEERYRRRNRKPSEIKEARSHGQF